MKKDRDITKMYIMQYKCCNCGILFTKHLPKGTIGRKNGGECPVCGVEDDSNGGIHEVMGHTQYGIA